MSLPGWLPQSRLGFGAILLLGAFLRLRGLGTESFWHDESWTWGLIRGGPAHLLFLLRDQDAHPPLYFLIVQLFSLFGTSETVLRLPSALAGIAALPFVYRFAARLGGPPAGLMTMLLLALSPFHIVFSQDARSYALLFLLGAVSLDLLFGLRLAPDRRKLAALAVVTTAIMLTHYMGAFFLLSEAAVVLLLFRRDRPGLLREFGLAAAASFVLYLPWLPSFLLHTGRVGAGFWLPSPDWTLVGASLYFFVSHYYDPGILRGALAVLPFYVFLLATPLLARRREHVAVFLLFALPIVGELLASLHRPVYYARTLICVLIPLFTLASLRAFLLPPRFRAAACVLLCGGLVPSTLYLHRTLEKEAWRDVAEILTRAAEAGEPVLVDEGFLAENLEYQAARTLPPPPWVAQLRRVDSRCLEHAPVARADAQREAAAASGVWLVFRYRNDHGWFERLGKDFDHRGAWKRGGAEVHYFRRRPE